MRLTLSLAVVITLATNVHADEHHKEWLKFFEGDWVGAPRMSTNGGIEWTDAPKISRTISLLANGNAVLGRRQGEDGSTAVVLLGWNPVEKAIVETGYNSEGATWRVEYNEITADTMTGKAVGFSAEGTMSGNIRLQRKDDRFNIVGDLTLPDGTVMKIESTVKRRP